MINSAIVMYHIKGQDRDTCLSDTHEMEKIWLSKNAMRYKPKN